MANNPQDTSPASARAVEVGHDELRQDEDDHSDTEVVPDEYYWTRETDCTLGFEIDGRPVSVPWACLYA